jgi:hypothetical protein
MLGAFSARRTKRTRVYWRIGTLTLGSDQAKGSWPSKIALVLGRVMGDISLDAGHCSRSCRNAP